MKEKIIFNSRRLTASALLLFTLFLVYPKEANAWGWSYHNSAMYCPSTGEAYTHSHGEYTLFGITFATSDTYRDGNGNDLGGNPCSSGD